MTDYIIALFFIGLYSFLVSWALWIDQQCRGK